MLLTVCFGLFLPLIGFLVLLATSYTIERRPAGLIACATILLSFFCFAGLLLFLYTQQSLAPEQFTLFNWIPVKGMRADFSLFIDPLSLLMTLIITGVGFFIHVYSIGYMNHDEDYARYFACLNFFVFAMLLLVLASNLLLLFVGWEGVGLASYLLIGFWYKRPAAARAATKAFVVNRIGDFGLLIGLLLTFHLFGTSDIITVLQRAQQGFEVGAPIITILTLLYFWGATGKSAQLPLYNWLPDAMEGPTPVSALIHAATMVTAGVYLVVRMHPLFMLAPISLNVIGNIGAITALFAALCALAQMDLKRVLAYSTVSQLGFMFLACGVGAFYAAMFHLTMHAFIKALLFLSAGNVIHMLHGTTNLDEMGGLAKVFTKTNWLFLIGVLAMSGIPPLAAFFSKDLILEQQYLLGSKTLFYIGLLTSILTAFYLTRAYCLTFMGSSHFNSKILKMIQEAPAVMLIPVSVLALLSVIGGFLGFNFGNPSILESFLAKAGIGLVGGESHLLTPQAGMAIMGSLLGIGTAAYVYTRLKDRLGKSIIFLKRAFFIDDLYRKLIVNPLRAFSQLITQTIEPKFFDATISFIAQTVQAMSQELQRIQSGQIRSYLAWMVAGTAILIVYFIL